MYTNGIEFHTGRVMARPLMPEILALTVDMAYSHGRQGIRVNAIAPGHITTPMVVSVAAPGPRAEFMNKMRSEAGLLGTPGDGWDVGWAAVFLASDEARWITGQVVHSEGGFLRT